jgi:hypothetical protein
VLLTNVTADRSERSHIGVIEVYVTALSGAVVGRQRHQLCGAQSLGMAHPTDPQSRKAYLEFAENCLREAEQTSDRKTAEMLLTLADRYKRISEGLPPDKTAAVNDEQRRALDLLARHPSGCSEQVLLAEGFTVGQLTALVMDGFARMEHTVVRDGEREKIAALIQITEAGRKVIKG